MPSREEITREIQECILPKPGIKTWVTPLIAGEIRKDVMLRLDELGVVIKVDREFPEYVIGINTTSESSKMLAEEVQRDMLEAGYVAVEEI